MNEQKKKALLRDIKTRELLNKQILWQFQLQAIKDVKGHLGEQRRAELEQELELIEAELQYREDLESELTAMLGSSKGEGDLTSLPKSSSQIIKMKTLDLKVKRGIDP